MPQRVKDTTIRSLISIAIVYGYYFLIRGNETIKYEKVYSALKVGIGVMIDSTNTFLNSFYTAKLV